MGDGSNIHDTAAEMANAQRMEIEAEIARREKQLTEEKIARRTRLRDAPLPMFREPNRNWHVFALGADLADCGLLGSDALALMGLRSLPVTRLARILLSAAAKTPATYLGRLLPGIIDQHRDELQARGLLVSHNRRRVQYEADCESWNAQSEALKQGRWRDQPMTKNQRELVRVTAVLLDIPIPQELRRGTAADWLSANNANLTYNHL